MCLCFFADGPVDDDKRAGRANMFKTGMKDAPCINPMFCCVSLICFPCSNCYLRYLALDEQLENYTCCQGYYDCMCFKAGSIGDAGNPCCLAIEGWCCHSCAVSATRSFVMDKYDLRSDPCDNQIIRFNNFMQILACLCQIAAIIDPMFGDAAELIRFIADIVYAITAACMNAQAHHEITERNKEGGGGGAQYAQQGGGGGGHQQGYDGGFTPGYAQAPKVEERMERPGRHPGASVAQAVAVVQPQRTFLVVVPQNVYAGTQLQVQDPNGNSVVFAVPPGASAGQQVLVPY
ncbi:hypothetical protein M885DRAFT_537239 [Pelagophyceae sp. CCMP2097]|nr:hypothetical protein M885DRAFT_537239 [Pelagophyceae sp. CCMP2097]